MSTEAEMAWAAGLFEGEGCIYFSSSHGHRVRGLVINMCDEDVLRKFASIVGAGRVRAIKRGNWMKPHYKDQWGWHVGRFSDIARILKAFEPWFGQRRRTKALEILAMPPQDPYAFRKTHCMRGHPLDGPGSSVRVVRFGMKTQRNCRLCQQARSRAHRARRRELRAA